MGRVALELLLRGILRSQEELADLHWEDPPRYRPPSVGRSIRQAINVCLKELEGTRLPHAIKIELREKLGVLGQRPDGSAVLSIQNALAAFPKDRRMEERGRALAVFFKDLPKDLSLPAIMAILPVLPDKEWLHAKLLEQASTQSRQTVQRFLNHGVRTGLLERRGRKNTGFEYRRTPISE